MNDLFMNVGETIGMLVEAWSVPRAVVNGGMLLIGARGSASSASDPEEAMRCASLPLTAMSDLIRLLPDHVANQIAAGEVVQRPASVVKELLENSVDAGASRVVVVVKDAGRTIIQVTDDGRGMSENDARLSFERHATSKIRQAEDLLAVRTKGFRGEALASIAAIAQVELRTRLHDAELGTRVLIEGSRTKAQEHCATPAGTTVAVRSLFYNVPARRQFLKSDQVEMKHLIDEFQRVALAHPEIAFHLVHNEQEVFDLPAASSATSASALRQRVVNLFGRRYDERLVPVEEATEFVSVRGFVGKPEFARRSRGEQFFFVNHRYIRSNYLDHAVRSAFDELISRENYPSWFLAIDLDPARREHEDRPRLLATGEVDEVARLTVLEAHIVRAIPGRGAEDDRHSVLREKSQDGITATAVEVGAEVVILVANGRVVLLGRRRERGDHCGE